MPGTEPFEYYGTPRAAPGLDQQGEPALDPRIAHLRRATGADFLGPTPALVVHGRRDEYCSPAAAQEVYDRITGPKELLWLDTTNHIDLYDQPPSSAQPWTASRAG